VVEQALRRNADHLPAMTCCIDVMIGDAPYCIHREFTMWEKANTAKRRVCET